MTPTFKRFATAALAAKACAEQVVSLLEEAIDVNGRATLAVSGGRTPQTMFDCLAKADLDWTAVHLFQVDERAVPPEHPESNYALLLSHFIQPAHFPRNNVHRIQSEVEPTKAARLYASEIREFFSVDDGDLPRFDVIHLGTGSDAHTASLFPGTTLIDDREGFVAAVRGPNPPFDRVTLLPGVLLAARNALFLTSGEDKAEAVRSIFHGETDYKRYPAQLITRQGRRVTWYLDDAAASLLN